MEESHAPPILAALYGSLANAEAALNALMADGVPYERMRLGAHSGADPARALLADAVPEQFWSLAVKAGGRDPRQLAERLASHGALAIGRVRAPELERREADRGNTAWGHLVFETPDATGQQPEASGTSGTTGVTRSGAFADGANTQREPRP